MLLRRFMQHVKDQNWIAVGLDLCVVVLGIILGLQVTNWNQQRQDRALEQQYLERLRQDLNANVDELTNLGEFHGRIRNNLNDIASFLMLAEWDQEAHLEITKQLMPWGAVPSASLQMGAWEELVSTGRLTLLQDKRLRELLQKVAASHSQSVGMIEYSRLNNGRLEDKLDKVSYLHRAESGEMFIRFNFQPVHQDKSFVTLLLLQASRQAQLQQIRKQQAFINKTTLNYLRCLMDKQECNQDQTKPISVKNNSKDTE